MRSDSMFESVALNFTLPINSC